MIIEDLDDCHLLYQAGVFFPRALHPHAVIRGQINRPGVGRARHLMPTVWWTAWNVIETRRNCKLGQNKENSPRNRLRIISGDGAFRIQRFLEFVHAADQHETIIAGKTRK